MGFAVAIMICLRKAVDFRGRARRSEFWYFLLFWLVVAVFCGARLPKVPADAVSLRIAFAAAPLLLLPAMLLLPLAAVAVRRLHDIGMSGWWLLSAGTPIPVLDAFIVGAQVFCFARPGTSGDNRYGPDPRTAA